MVYDTDYYKIIDDFFVLSFCNNNGKCLNMVMWLTRCFHCGCQGRLDLLLIGNVAPGVQEQLTLHGTGLSEEYIRWDMTPGKYLVSLGETFCKRRPKTCFLTELEGHSFFTLLLLFILGNRYFGNVMLKIIGL